MIAPNLYISSHDLFQGKTQTVRDLYALLLDELRKIGFVREIQKQISVSFENRKVFATALIRNSSIKLVLRTDHKINSPRVHSLSHVAEKSYDHTILVESRADIDAELVQWMAEAYHAN